MDGAVRDVVAPPRSILRFWQPRAQKSVSLHALDEAVTTLVADDRIKGLVVTLAAFDAGMAAATSLRGQLGRVRAAGKEVVVHLPMGADSKEVYVASVANKVYLAPTSQIGALGFRSGSVYLKSALERAGVEPQVFSCGEFKSAGETLVRDSMSPQQRAQLERLLDGFHDALVDGVASGRGLTPPQAIATIDGAPYFGRAAAASGLVDDVAYEDEVPAKIGVVKVEDLVDVFSYLAKTKRRFFRRVRKPPVIAVVPIHGAITHASGRFGGLSTDERVGRMIRAARKNPRVKGVIIHVDSGGGSALASDRMHHEIAQLAREKPVVACMANVAASGGYYVAAPAKLIVAQPTTVTGSIGVVAARMSLDPLLAKLGIHRESVERGARAGLLSPIGALTDEDRAAVNRELDATYRSFIGVVAAGRGMPEVEVEKLARGRVYTGTDAHAAKLVDVLGGFEVAVAETRRLLPETLRDRCEIALMTAPRNAVAPLDPPKAAAAALLSLLPTELQLLFASNERVLAIGPIHET